MRAISMDVGTLISVMANLVPNVIALLRNTDRAVLSPALVPVVSSTRSPVLGARPPDRPREPPAATLPGAPPRPRAHSPRAPRRSTSMPWRSSNVGSLPSALSCARPPSASLRSSSASRASRTLVRRARGLRSRAGPRSRPFRTTSAVAPVLRATTGSAEIIASWSELDTFVRSDRATKTSAAR